MSTSDVISGKKHFKKLMKGLVKLHPPSSLIEIAIEGLQNLDPGIGMNEFNTTVWAMVKIGLPKEKVRAWARGDWHQKEEKKYKENPSAFDKLWENYKPEKAAKNVIAQFFELVEKESGWTPPKGYQSLMPLAPPAHAAEKASSSPSPTDGIDKPSKEHLDGVATLWKSYEPPPEASYTVADKHPYAKAKGAASAYGMRVVPDDAEQYAGWLAVPLYDFAGQLVAIHHISAVPKAKASGGLSWPKYTTPGTMGEAFYTDDLPKKGTKTRVLIVEGIGVAWALRKMYPDNYIVATCGSARFPKVARAVRSHCGRGTPIVIAQDAGGALVKAQEAAKAVHGAYLTWPDDIASNTGLDDLKPEAAKALLAGAVWIKKPYQRVSVSELMNAPPLRWIVQDVVPESGLFMVYGGYSAGKSFLMLDLAAHIAAGEPWFGKKTKQRPVSYLMLEGRHGLGQRVQAWAKHHGKAMPDTVGFFLDRFDLRRVEDRDALCAEIEDSGAAGGVFILDTLSKSAMGTDENSSADMGELVDACDLIQRRLGGAVIVVHHAGKSDSAGPRGHTKLPDATDMYMAVSRDRVANTRQWTTGKLRDGEDGAGYAFELKKVHLYDDDGQPVTSAVVVYEDKGQGPAKAAPSKAKMPTLYKNQKLAYDALLPVFKEKNTFNQGGAPKGALCLDYVVAFNTVSHKMPGENKGHRDTRANEVLPALMAKGVLGTAGGFVWLNTDWLS